MQLGAQRAGLRGRLGGELALDVVPIDAEEVAPAPGDLALVVASHGLGEVQALRRGLEAGLPYVGLVASGKRGDGVLGELRGEAPPTEFLKPPKDEKKPDGKKKP